MNEQISQEIITGFTSFEKAFQYLKNLGGRTITGREDRELSFRLKSAPPEQDIVRDVEVTSFNGQLKEVFTVCNSSKTRRGLIYYTWVPCSRTETLLGQEVYLEDPTKLRADDFADPKMTPEEIIALRETKAIELAERIRRLIGEPSPLTVS